MYRQKDIKPKNIYRCDGMVAIASDIHFPFQDDKAVKAFIDYCEKNKPAVVIIAGDVLDFYKLSRFTKGEGRNPYEEMEMCRDFFRTLRERVGEETEIYYVIGNHETRLENYTLSNAPQLATLIEDVFTILKVSEFKVIGCSEVVINNEFVVTHGKLLGNKAGLSAIKEIEKHYMSGASGHCFSEDVEVITPAGWKRVIDIQLGELVGTYNKQTKEFEYNKVNDKFVYDNYSKLYHIKSNCIDIMTTDKHGFIGYGATGKLKEFTAKDLGKMSTVKIPLACQGGNPPIALSDDMIRLLVNISADACIEGKSFRFHLKKERKIKHLTELLDRLEFEYSVRPQACGTTKIGISVKNSLPILNKYFKSGIKSLPIQLREVNAEQARIILDEYSITDGNKNKYSVNAYQISTSKKAEADLLQEIFVKNGMRSSLIQRDRDRENPYYVLTVNLRGVANINKHNVRIIPYEGKVSCVSVDNGTLVVRSKGKTIVTQNTHRLAHFITRKAGRKFEWFETGCLCRLDPEYVQDPDWWQGFVVLYYEDARRVFGKTIEIQDGKILEV